MDAYNESYSVLLTLDQYRREIVGMQAGGAYVGDLIEDYEAQCAAAGIDGATWEGVED